MVDSRVCSETYAIVCGDANSVANGTPVEAKEDSVGGG